MENKVVWITGASSGIGRALAIEWAQHSVHLILSGRNLSALQKVADRCKERGSSCLVLDFDLNDIDNYPKWVDSALKWKGHIDYLVNNGGVSQRGLAHQTEVAVDQAIVHLDLIAPIALTKAVLPSMISRDSGHIITTSSLVGKFGSPYRSAYSAAKHGLHGFFDSTRAELHKTSLCFTVLCPGFVQTQVSVNGLGPKGNPTGKMDDATQNGISPERFARKALKAIKSQKREAYIGGWEVAGIYVSRWFPGLFARMIRNAKVI